MQDKMGFCHLGGVSHDGSVGEIMHLTVCSLRGLGYDSSVGERMHPTVCPLHGLGSIPGRGGVFQEILPGSLPIMYPGKASNQRFNRPLSAPHLTPDGHLLGTCTTPDS